MVRRHGRVHRRRPQRDRQVHARRARMPQDVGLFPGPRGRAPARSAAELPHGPDRGAGRRRQPDRRRARGDLHPRSLRRARDDHESHRQRGAPVAAPSRSAGVAARGPGAHSRRDRGGAALRRPDERAGARGRGGSRAARPPPAGGRPGLRHGQFGQPRPAPVLRARALRHHPHAEPAPDLRAGVHLCLGATLAREEGRVAVQALFERFPGAGPRPGGAARTARRDGAARHPAPARAPERCAATDGRARRRHGSRSARPSGGPTGAARR